MKYKNIYNIILILILLAIILFIVFSYIAGIKNSPQESIKKTNKDIRYQYAKPSHSIKGLKYIEYSGSRKIISIRCRQFTMHRKKLGFIRFALMKEAVLSDAVITLYLYPENNGKIFHKAIASRTVASKAIASKTIVPALVTMDSREIKKTFAALISKKSGLLSKFKHVFSIIVHPVTIELFSNDQKISSISAMTALISLSSRKILFKRNVIIISGKKKLMLDRLELNPDTMLLTGTNYIFYSPEGKRSGHRITTNFRLQKVYK